jgi:23S rRNA pseudouridine2604 synthase
LYKAITTRDTIEKEYEVTVNRNISDAELSQLASGIEIMGSITLPAIVSRCGNSKFRIILKEGRNRQIRRMCYKLNLEVERLVRIRIHDLMIGDLNPGEFRNATAGEIELLRSLYKHKFIGG